jgi:hypothetical protein
MTNRTESNIFIFSLYRFSDTTGKNLFPRQFKLYIRKDDILFATLAKILKFCTITYTLVRVSAVYRAYRVYRAYQEIGSVNRGPVGTLQYYAASLSWH